MRLLIERPRAGDRAPWELLYLGYREFYGQGRDDAAADRVWQWITTEDAPLEGRVARSGDDRIIGLMHFRDVPRPLEGAVGGWLDDLFVAEAARGSGVADAMIETLVDIGRARGWTCIRWLTSESNSRARAFYERLAEKTSFLTYEIRL